MTDHAQASLDRILRSGEYVCRPRRQIFVEHTFFNRAGQKTREVTKTDLDAIASNGNTLAQGSGDLSPIGFGHTYDDQLDPEGKIVRKFAEQDQPKPIGYLHNYAVAQRSDGKWALFADEWIRRTLTDEHGRPVDGLQYAATFPRRSAEYYPGRKWIDWLALLRRAPALNLGLDVYSLQRTNPDKVCYRHEGTALRVAAVETTRGKWRYAEDDSMDEPKPAAPASPPSPAAPAASGPSAPSAPAAAPPNSPASPPDNNAPETPPIPGAAEALPPEHVQAAEKYALHTMGVHPTRLKPLMQHLHTMYGANCGFSGEPHTPHVAAVPGPGSPAPSPAAPAAPGATPPAPHPQHSAGPGAPAAGNTFIPGSEEHKRMSAVQAGIETHRAQTESEKLRYEMDQLKTELASIQVAKRRADYERDLTALMGMGYEFTLSKEMDRADKWAYAADRCTEQIQCIKENYQRAPVGTGEFLQTAPGVQPSLPGANGDVTREQMTKAKKYSMQHGCDFDEALAHVRGA